MTYSLFYTVSNNFFQMEVIIPMNKFSLIQLCINGLGEGFRSLLLKCILETKRGRPLALISFTKIVRLHSDKSSKACDGFYCKWKPFILRRTHVKEYWMKAHNIRTFDEVLLRKI